jgi:hypothetical protein
LGPGLTPRFHAWFLAVVRAAMKDALGHEEFIQGRGTLPEEKKEE